MDYEIFFWLEGTFCVLFAFGLLGIIVGTIVGGVCKITPHTDAYLSEETRSLMNSWGNRLLVLVGICVFILCVSCPLANFTETYKKVLIYRGINSTLADKSIDTADKALDLLNLKLDEEMGKLKAEKE